jgi:hypothetical protein
MPRPTSARLGQACLWLIALVVSMSRVAPAETHAERTVAWARSHGLPSRSIPIDLPGRKATCVFVPVGEPHWESFVKELTEGKGVIIRQSTDPEHPLLAFSRAVTVHMGSIGNTGPARFNDGRSGLVPSMGGIYLALGLSAERVAYLKVHLTTAVNDASGYRNQSGDGGCMWWLVRAMAGPNLPLAHALGVRQTTAPSNLARKLIHAGTDDVAVGMALMPPASTHNFALQAQQYRDRALQYRGHPTQAFYGPYFEALAAQIERQLMLATKGFEGMSDEELMGVPPAGGAYEAVRK